LNFMPMYIVRIKCSTSCPCINYSYWLMLNDLKWVTDQHVLQKKFI
jgi:hypothetical protein